MTLSAPPTPHPVLQGTQTPSTAILELSPVTGTNSKTQSSGQAGPTRRFPTPQELLAQLQAAAKSAVGGQEETEPAFAYSEKMAQALATEGLGFEEMILRVVEGEPMGIERLAELLGTKAGTLRPTIRLLEGEGLLETHRDRLMLGPAHTVALPCSETAVTLILGAFQRRQISRQDVAKHTKLHEDTIRQGTAALVGTGEVKLQFVGNMPIFELTGDLVGLEGRLPKWASKPAKTAVPAETSASGLRSGARHRAALINKLSGLPEAEKRSGRAPIVQSPTQSTPWYARPRAES